jgi:hypothetical protein
LFSPGGHAGKSRRVAAAAKRFSSRNQAILSSKYDAKITQSIIGVAAAVFKGRLP